MEFLTKRFKRSKDKEAVVWEGRSYKYEWLLEEIARWKTDLMSRRIEPGCVVILKADFSPRSIALFLALAEHKCIIVPMMSFAESQSRRLIEIAQGEVLISIGKGDREQISMLPHVSRHNLYERLREIKSPGLILFSSGSTGEPKASLHDLNSLMFKFESKRHRYRTIAFLLFDHIGGINTMLYTLSNTGCMIAVRDRTPENVLELIEKHRADLLPTSPTFLNLLLLCESFEKYNLSSLRLVTYGTEPMHASILKRLNDLLPRVRFLQTYGMSEMGILRSKSKSSDSLWVKVGGEGFETRIVNGILQIKARSAMLGYLNAESPFTKDGWFITGDEVETDGEYFKILGRRSDMINVGGQKVFPAEVENVIRTIENVAEVTVYGEPFPITNNIVCADVRLRTQEDHKEFISKVKKRCQERLETYKVPMKVNIVGEKQHNVRFKTVRKPPPANLRHKPKIAFVFAGQGPRWPHTTRQLLGKESVFQSVLEECDELLRQHADWSFLQEMKRKRPIPLLDETRVAQPATFAVQIALSALWQSRGIVPDAVIGHSMGEVSAAFCAGSLNLKDGIRVIYHRARVTQQVAGQGRMAWVDLPLDKTRKLLERWKDRLSVAANNEPRTTVVSGETDALKRFLESLHRKKILCQLLSFGHGFHSPLMTQFQGDLSKALEGIRPRRSEIPIVSTVTGDFVFGHTLDNDYWAKNIRETVLFVTAINRLLDSGIEIFLEISPHALLTGSVTQCLNERNYKGTVLHSLYRDRRSKTELSKTLRALHCLGVTDR